MSSTPTTRFQFATRATPREINRQILLTLIRQCQPIARAELARRLGIRRSALTAVVRELVTGGELRECADEAPFTRPGRPSVLLRIATPTVDDQAR